MNKKIVGYIVIHTLITLGVLALSGVFFWESYVRIGEGVRDIVLAIIGLYTGLFDVKLPFRTDTIVTGSSALKISSIVDFEAIKAKFVAFGNNFIDLGNFFGYAYNAVKFIYIDAFWGYALSNKWDYFITLTTDPKKVNRYDDREVKQVCWRNCRRRLQYFDKDVKILLIPERHKKENEHRQHALHFHGLVAMNRQFELKLHYEKDKPLTSQTGAPLFEFPFWDYGIATAAVLYDGDGEQNQRHVVAYLNKYMGKELGCVGYEQKRFYRTRNVVAKSKIIENFDADELYLNYGVRIRKLGEGEDCAYDVEVNPESDFECYKSGTGRIILREKRKEKREEDKNAVMITKRGLEYMSLAKAESMVEAGEAELVCTNAQYKTFREKSAGNE